MTEETTQDALRSNDELGDAELLKQWHEIIAKWDRELAFLGHTGIDREIEVHRAQLSTVMEFMSKVIYRLIEKPNAEVSGGGAFAQSG